MAGGLYLIRHRCTVQGDHHCSHMFVYPGDIMGTALQNLDRLVQMPSGCGEQNMVLFAPIIYVLQYLEKTGQLTPEIRERATGFLHSGKYPEPSSTSVQSGTGHANSPSPAPPLELPAFTLAQLCSI